MCDFDYFSMIRQQILFEKFYLPRPIESPPPVMIIPAFPEEPREKISIPLKQINEEFHIKKLKKINEKKNKIKNKKQKNIFLDSKNHLSNIHCKSSDKYINKVELKKKFNHENEFKQSKKIFVINKIGKNNNIIFNKSKNNIFNKSSELFQINYKFNKIVLNKNIRRIRTMDNLKRNIINN